jgi:8-oxo-dGTP pyrophosphatase MutT (NUDIX family)
MLVDMEWVRRAFHAAAPSSPSDPTRAAAQAVIAAILRPGAQGAELLLIRRAENPKDPWSGHMALPGGRRDDTDVDLLETAIREVREEVQIDLRRDAQLLGRLPSARALARGRDIDLEIFPIVYALQREIAPLPSPTEVQSIVWASIPHLLSAASNSSFEYSVPGQRLRFPAFDVDGHRIWGLTYRVLADLLDVIHPARKGQRREGSDGPGDL